MRAIQYGKYALRRSNECSCIRCQMASRRLGVPTTVRLIKQAAALAALPDTTDSTVYGINPRNTSSYFTHHVAAISNALVNAEAIILLDAGAKLTRDLTGMPGAA